MKKICLILAMMLGLSGAAKAQWELSSNGISSKYNISITSLGVSGSKIIAGTGYDAEGNGVFYSSNNGSSWTQINNGLPNLGIPCVAILGEKFFAGSQCNGSLCNGIYSSTDNGTTWKNCNHGILDNSFIQTLKVENSIIYAGTSKGLYISKDTGNSWKLLNQKFAGINIMKISVSDSMILVRTYTGLYLSSDYGNSWIDIHPPQLQLYSIAVKSDSIFFSYDSLYYSVGFYFSSDKGKSWKKSVENGFISYIMTILPLQNLILIGYWKGGVYVSSNLEKAWIPRNTGLTGYGSEVIDLAYNEEYIFAGTEGGIYRAKLSDFGISSAKVSTSSYKEAISISPNPASDYITITNDQLQITNVEIYNAYGERMIRKTSDVWQTSDVSTRIDISSLPSGIYYCCISAGTQRITKSFVVMR
ncbi:MAG: T9SS type A sorting domain-containing protein [Candidatus Kapabacteria bacterium]|nr:T9SS type A sorting domain-containing protein [Candidatus Kapabacteria bacterium]